MVVAVPEDHEGAAADAGTLRLDEVEDELNGDRRVDGAAAGGEDLPAGLGGQGIGRGDHVLRCRAGGLERASRGSFGGRSERPGQRAGADKGRLARRPKPKKASPKSALA